MDNKSGPKVTPKKVDKAQNVQPGKRKHEEEDSSESENDETQWMEQVEINDLSDSEPDLECEIWDDDCYTIAKQKRKDAIIGFNLGHGLQPTNVPESNSSTAKQLKLSLSENIIKENFKTLFKASWSSETNYTEQNVNLTNDPFKFCSVDNFLENVRVLDKVRLEMNNIDWNKRQMDLYEFFQSDDLEYIDDEHVYIKKMWEFLKTDVKKWLCDISGEELVKMSSTCSFYSDTDYLLVHDDLQDDRSIAFVLYMTDPKQNSSDELWTEEMGGALELFAKDNDGHPTKCVKKVSPKNNRFIFFKVTDASYHQVQEILNMDHSRYSINGWFHTRNENPHSPPVLEPPLKGLFSNHFLRPLDYKTHLLSWISPDYLHRNSKMEIQKQIETESEVSLHNFFKKDKFEDLFEAITNNDVLWEMVGPPNRRKYEVCCTEYIPSILDDFLKMFQSREMFSLLKDYTELDLIEGERMKPTLRMELQRWTPGCYSLLSEFDWENERELDVIMYLGYSQVVGGQTLYVAAEDKIEDAIICLETMDNTLNIVFRDTTKLVKHISNRSRTQCFYMFVASYKE